MTQKATSKEKSSSQASTPAASAASKKEEVGLVVYLRDFIKEVDKDFSILLSKFHSAEIHTVGEWDKILNDIKTKKIF